MATYALLSGRFRLISRVNHISWMEVVIQTDRLKSVRLIVGGVFVFALDILCSDRIGFFHRIKFYQRIKNWNELPKHIKKRRAKKVLKKE